MFTETATWLDGEPATALPLPDRAVEFGDGLFETLLLRDGRPLFPELHWQRLRLGLQVLAFPDCLGFARSCLEAAAGQLAGRGWRWSALRLTVSRGAGPRGYAAPEPATPRVLVSATELQRDCTRMQSPAILAPAGVRWSTQPALAGIKHLNRLEQVMAASAARSAGADEALMLDQAGRPLSVSAGNLFLVREGVLYTPPLDDCGIRGTRRQLVLERLAPALGIGASESAQTLAQLESAQEVFYCSSLAGLRPVARLGAARWDAHPVCAALHDRYLDELG